jgi:hypothetical protein
MARVLRGRHATSRVAPILVALGVACLGLSSTNALAAPTTTTTLSPAIVLAGNAYARHLLAAQPVPGTAREVTALATPIALTGAVSGAPDVREARHFYVLPMSVQVQQYVRAHLSAHETVTGTGSSGGPNVIPEHEMSVSLTCVSQHIVFCGVSYATTEAKDGEQELEVTVQVIYLPILHVTMPTGGDVTVTGFGTTSLMNASSDPSSVSLTHDQVVALRRAVAGLKDLGPNGDCMEDSLLLKIEVVKDGRVTWSATADACPGGLTITSSTASVILDNRSCSFWHVIDSFFPAGTAAATKSASRDCDASQFG